MSIHSTNLHKYPQFDKIQNDNDDFVITDILLDHNNNLLLASNKGLLLFDKKKETFKIQKASTQIPAALHSNYIQNIIKDNSGSLWFATWGNGMDLTNIFFVFSPLILTGIHSVGLKELLNRMKLKYG